MHPSVTVCPQQLHNEMVKDKEAGGFEKAYKNGIVQFSESTLRVY